MKLSEAFGALPLLPEAFFALLAARNRLVGMPASQIIQDLQGQQNGLVSPDIATVHGVSRVIRVGARLAPFRSDCLIQAMAANAMLTRRGIASQFYIGVSRRAGGEFTAHAWLKSGGEIVVGGDVSSFTPLIEPGPAVALKRSD